MVTVIISLIGAIRDSSVLLTIGLLGGGVQVSAGSTDVGGDKLAINGGFNIAFFDVVVSSIVVPFFAAVICGMPLLVDADRRIRPLLLATPLRHGEYACGRFVASMGVLAFVIAGWQLMQVVAFESWPLDPSRTVRTAFSLGNYLTPVLLFVVPLAIFTGGALQLGEVVADMSGSLWYSTAASSTLSQSAAVWS